MKNTNVQKVVLLGTAAQMLCLQALAQGIPVQQNSTTVSALSTSSPDIAALPNLTVLDPQSAPPECNKEIMQNLNSQYLLNRGNARIVQYNNQMNGLVLTTPKANQMDCFQQAMQNIKTLMAAINNILALFTLQPDMDAIMQQIVGMVLKAACQEVNQVTGSISGSLNTPTNAINGTIGNINSATTGVVGANLNQGNSLNSGSKVDGSVQQGAGSVLVKTMNAINPFGSSN